jgi:hypothetical protein
VHDDLRDHTKKKVFKERGGESKVGPVVSVLKNVQSIALEVNLAIKVKLVEGLHGDLVVSLVLGSEISVLELEVVLNAKVRELGLVADTGRIGRSNGPESKKDGEEPKKNKENVGVKATTDLVLAVIRNEEEERQEQGVGEMTGRWTVNNQSTIFDGRVLEKLAIDPRKKKITIVLKF